MTAPMLDPDLLAGLEALDDACDARSIVVDVSEDVLPAQPGSTEGVLAVALHVRPKVGTATPHVLRAPYNERTGEWLRALARRVLAARSWTPDEWARLAVADVLGTADAPADEVARTADVRPAPESG